MITFLAVATLGLTVGANAIDLAQIQAQTASNWSLVTQAPARLVTINSSYYKPEGRAPGITDPTARKFVAAQSEQSERRQIVSDPSRKMFRVQVEDFRNITAILAKNGLGKEDASEITRNQGTLVGTGNGETVVADYNQASKQFTMRHYIGPMRYDDEPNLTAGLLSPEFFELARERRAKVENANVEGKDLTQVTMEFKGSRVETLLDPELDYHVKTMKTYDSKGRLSRQESFADYKKVDKAWYPMSQKILVPDEKGGINAKYDTKVERVEFGVTLTQEDMMIMLPKGSMAVDFVPDAQDATKLHMKSSRVEKDMLVDLVLAPLLCEGVFSIEKPGESAYQSQPSSAPAGPSPEEIAQAPGFCQSIETTAESPEWKFCVGSVTERDRLRLASEVPMPSQSMLVVFDRKEDGEWYRVVVDMSGEFAFMQVPHLSKGGVRTMPGANKLFVGCFPGHAVTSLKITGLTEAQRDVFEKDAQRVTSAAAKSQAIVIDVDAKKTHIPTLFSVLRKSFPLKLMERIVVIKRGSLDAADVVSEMR